MLFRDTNERECPVCCDRKTAFHVCGKCLDFVCEDCGTSMANDRRCPKCREVLDSIEAPPRVTPPLGLPPGLLNFPPDLDDLFSSIHEFLHSHILHDGDSEEEEEEEDPLEKAAVDGDLTTIRRLVEEEGNTEYRNALGSRRRGPE